MAKPTAITEFGGTKMMGAFGPEATTPGYYGAVAIETAVTSETTTPASWWGFATHQQGDTLTSPNGFTIGGAGPVVLAAGLDGTTVRALAVNADGELGIHDGGNSLTIDGTVAVSAVSGTVAVTQSGTWNIGTVATITNVVHVDDNAGSLTVDGTVAATQSGSWVLAANDGVDIGDVTINNAAGAAAVNIQDGGNSITVDGTVDINTVTGTVDVNVVGGTTGATEYTEGATDASITGVAAMWEDTGDTLRPVSAASPLPVAIITGGGTGGTADTDDAAFTAGSGSGTPMMGFATSDLVDAGDVGVVGMTTARGLFVNLRDDAGDSCMDGGNNAVRVNIVAGAGSGGTAMTDRSTFSDGSTSFTPMGGVFNDSITDATAGQGASARITAKRGLHINLRNVSGTEIGTSGAPVRVDTTGTTTQPVSGTINAAQSGTWNITNVSGTITLPTGAATSANQSTEITSLQLLDDVVATDGSAALTKLYQVGGTDGTNAQILSTNTSGHVNIADGGNSLTVDNSGTFAVQAAQSGTWNVNQAGTWNITNISGTITLPTGASTSANQTTEITSLQLLDDVVATDGSAALTKLYQVGGTDGTNAQIFSTDTSGRLNVNVVGGPSGGTSSVDDSAFTVAVGSGTPFMGMADEAATDSVDEGDVGVVRMTLDRKLLTRVVGSTDANRLEVDASGRVTANLAAGTNNIGDVDILTVPAPLSTTGNGTAAAALRVTVASDSTGQLTANAGTGTYACNLAILATTLNVTGTATAIPTSALANRRRVVVQNTDTTNSIFIGGSGVTATGATKGMEVIAGFAQSLEAGPGVGIYAITAGGTISVCILELS